MSTHARVVTKQFRIGTPGILASDLLAIGTVNLEVQVTVDTLPPELYGLPAKVRVDGISRPKERDGVFSVRLTDNGTECRFRGKEGYVKIGGGAANAIAVVRQLERDSGKKSRLGLVGGIGRGDKARHLLDDLRPEEPHENEPPWFMNGMPPIELGLLPTLGTSITLSLRVKRGPQMLLWQQKPYVEGATPTPALRLARPRITLFMSVKPEQLAFAEELTRVYLSHGRTFCAVSPSVAVLADEHLNERVRQVAQRVHLCAMNHREALMYLGESGPFGIGNHFDIKRMDNRVLLAQAVAQAGAPIAVVTFEEHGVIACAQKEIIMLPAWKHGPTRDVVGCGDAFMTALVTYYSGNNGAKVRAPADVDIERLREAVKRAVIVAGVKAAHKGPSSGVPTWEEVEMLLLKNKSPEG